MAINKAMRLAVFDKYSGRCAYCGCALDINTLRVDHIHPKERGGSDELINLNPSCNPCNNFKLVWTIEELRRELSLQIERARKYSVNFRNAERFGMLSIITTEVLFYFERLQSKPTSEQSK